MLDIRPSEMRYGTDGRPRFFRSLMCYWARFIPFWIVTGVICTLLWIVFR